MSEYEAGTAYLQILPSTRGFAGRLKRELAGVQQDVHVPVTLDLDRRGLSGLQAALRSIPIIVLDADSTPADRELAGLGQRISDLDGHTVGVTISGAEFRRELDAIQADLDRLGAQSPSIAVRVDAGAASAALAGVNREVSRVDGRTARLQVLADVAGAVASVASVALAVNQFANKSYSFHVDADTFGAAASIAGLVGKVSALGGLAGVVGGFGGALGGLGAAGAVAGAGVGAAVVASLGVGKALTALSAQQDGAAQAAQQSAKQQQAAGFAIASAQSRVAQAAQAAGRARVEAARSASDAEKNASRQLEQAVKTQATAQRTLRQATADLQREQSTLTQAWEDGRRSLQDLQDQVDGNALDQRQAALDLADARQALAEAQASGDGNQIARAQLALDRQVESMDQLAKQTQRLGADNAAAQRAGVAGTGQVVAANDRIAAGKQRVRDATVAAADADAAVVAARRDGAESVARAQEQGAQRIAAADQQVVDANRALTQALSQTGDAGSSAANKVETAFAALSPQAAEFARYLFGLQPVLQGLSATAAAQFFPPLRAGLDALLAQGPAINGMVSQLAAGMGAGLQLVLTTLASPHWMEFFGLLANASGTLIPALFGALLNVAYAGATLLTQLLPLAPAGLDLLNQFAGLVTVLAPFIAQLLGGLIPAASAFLDAVVPLGPVLAAMQPILLVLGQAFSTVLMAVLQALAPILVALTPLIQTLAVQLATNLVASIQTLTPFLVTVATWLSANPGLVIGVVTAVLGLAGAFKPLLFVLGLVVSWLHSFLIIQVARAALVAFGLQGTVFGGILLRLLSPMNLIRMALPLIARAVMWLGRSMLAALGPVGWLITAFTLLYSGNEAFRTAINGLLGTLGQLVGQLLGAVMPIFDALGGVLSMISGVFGALVAQLATALIPVITMLSGVLTQLVGTLLPPLMSIVGALVPVIMLLGQVFVQLVQGALAPLITLFGQLIANALPPLIAILTGVVIPVITFLANVLATVLSWVITNVVIPALSAIVPTVQWLGEALSWLWTNVVAPVFGFIGEAARVLFAVVATVLIVPLILAWQVLATVLGWLWSSVVAPVFGFIADLATWLWRNVMEPVWAGISAAIAWAWTNIIKPVLDALVWVFQNVIAPAAMWLWHNVLEPAFNGIGSIISWVWLNVIKPAWDAVVDGLNWLGDNFNRVVTWVGDIWNGLKALLAKPINFLIDTVWNHGVVPAWNAVAGLVGLGTIGELALIPEFAAGGIYRPDRYTPGRDIGYAAVSGGEAIMRPEFTRAVGPAWVDYWNHTARTGGPAAVRDRLSATEQSLGGDPSAPGLFYRGAFARGGVVDVMRFGDAQAGKPYQWGGTGPGGFDCSGLVSALVGVAQGGNPYQRRFATGTFSRNRGAGGLIPGLGSSFGVGVSPDTGSGIGHMAATVGGKNYESRGGDGVVVGPAARGALNALFPWKFSLPEAGGVFAGEPGGGGGSGGLFGFLADLARDAFNSFTNPAIDALRSLVGPPPPAFRELVPAIATTARDTVRDFVLGKAGAAEGGPAPSGQVNDWILQALGILGYPAGYAAGIFQQIQTESGGDPRAVQHGYVDVNTISGDLAKGIMQVIGSTFRANALPGHGDVFNPVDNIIAGSRYAMRRYGPSWFSPGPQHDHGYDAGGIGRGIGWMWKGTGLDERVLPPQETQAYPTLTRLSRQLEDGRVAVSIGTGRSDAAAAAAGRRPTGPTQMVGALYLDSGEFLGRVRGEVRSELAATSTALLSGRRT